LPLNDYLVFHLAQRLFLHYLGKTNQTKYALKETKKTWKKHPQHYQSYLK